jgi:orotidine-5'-phosphate decarboxylase
MKNPIIVALDVATAEEARALVARLGGSVDFYKVGMELYAAAGMELVGDQKRVATPEEAIRDGADYLVIGREITRAADPATEAHRVLSDVTAALRLRSPSNRS